MEEGWGHGQDRNKGSCREISYGPQSQISEGGEQMCEQTLANILMFE